MDSYVQNSWQAKERRLLALIDSLREEDEELAHSLSQSLNMFKNSARDYSAEQDAEGSVQE